MERAKDIKSSQDLELDWRVLTFTPHHIVLEKVWDLIAAHVDNVVSQYETAITQEEKDYYHKAVLGLLHYKNFHIPPELEYKTGKEN